LQYKTGFNVDISGNAVLANDNGDTAQIAFGMDNSYKCSLEVWGSSGTIYTNRIFTAPDDYKPVVTINTANSSETINTLPTDNSFKKSIEYFYSCIENQISRENNYKSIVLQAELVEGFVNGRL
jgi:hypothetical protein